MVLKKPKSLHIVLILMLYAFCIQSKNPIRLPDYSLSHSISLNSSDSIDVDIPEYIQVCKNETFQIELDSTYSYSWSPVFSNMCLNSQCSSVELTLTFDQEFTVVASNASGCEESFQLVIDIEGESNLFLQSDTICNGEQILFNGVLYSNSGSYCDTLLFDTICPQVQCLDLTVLPVDEIVETFEICEGEEYSWNDQLYTQPIFICVDTINRFGCDSIYCFDLVVNSLPEITIPDLQGTKEEGSLIQLVEINMYPFYEWSSSAELSCINCANPFFIITEPTHITLEVVDSNACKNTLERLINMNQSCRTENLLIPDAITLNGNNINERFRIVNFQELTNDIRIQIYNRWGQKIYDENGNIGWDGTYEGQLVPEDVYLYIIEVSCEDGDVELFKGDLTVLK